MQAEELMRTTTPLAGGDEASRGEERSVVRAYDRYARFYNLLFGWVLHDGRTTLGRVIASAPGDKVLEIGVGSGLMLPLYPASAQVLGVDLSGGMLLQAQRLLDRRGLKNVSLRLANAELDGLGTEQFDHVVLPYVYSVTPNPGLLMEQAFRCCKPGGNIWILNHFSGSSSWRHLERAFRPFAHFIGFRTHFPYATYVTEQGWTILAEYKVNLFSLSRLIQVQKPLLECAA